MLKVDIGKVGGVYEDRARGVCNESQEDFFTVCNGESRGFLTVCNGEVFLSFFMEYKNVPGFYSH